jgi:hypothetical protein
MSKEQISVLISSSPIRGHPSTAIIDETLRSIRYHLPDSPILIMADGVRPEQEHYAERYLEYISNLVGRVIFKMDNVKLVPFLEFTHQANMAMKTLEMVNTPLILFVEQDTPLMDRQIDWKMLKEAITSGATNHIRLHYDEQIHQDHQHMMCGRLTPYLIKCVQFHNRPYLTNTDWFRELLAANFTENSRTWIEDKVYGPISCAPWADYRLTIYDPEGTGRNMKRSADLNGRGGDIKYPPVF